MPSWLDLHVQRHAQSAYHWIVQNTGRNWLLDGIKSIGKGITWCQKRGLTFLRVLHWTGVVALTFVIGFLRAGWRTATIAAASMFAIGLCGFWDLTMVTLSIMIVAVAFAMLIGVPLGIWSGLSDSAERRLRPLLDTAQVMPAYVYLIPCVAFFGISVPAAIVATLIYAVPPAVRLTSLGLRQVPIVSTEVGRSFGSTGPQLLRKVQLPLARRSVLLGLNQVIMMAFGLVVIASQIGTGDVGVKVLAGLQKLDANLAFSAGLLHRVRGDRSRPHHHRRTQPETGANDAEVDGRSACSVGSRARRHRRRRPGGQGARRPGIPVVASAHRIMGQVDHRLVRQPRPPRRATDRWYRLDQHVPGSRHPHPVPRHAAIRCMVADRWCRGADRLGQQGLEAGPAVWLLPSSASPRCTTGTWPWTRSARC